MHHESTCMGVGTLACVNHHSNRNNNYYIMLHEGMKWNSGSAWAKTVHFVIILCMPKITSRYYATINSVVAAKGPLHGSSCLTHSQVKGVEDVTLCTYTSWITLILSKLYPLPPTPLCISRHITVSATIKWPLQCKRDWRQALAWKMYCGKKVTHKGCPPLPPRRACFIKRNVAE